MIKIIIEFDHNYMENKVEFLANPKDAWKVLNILQESKFVSYKEFVKKWCEAK